MNSATPPNSSSCKYFNILLSVIVKSLAVLLAVLPAPVHADAIPGQPASEEFELDLGPQGKEHNRDLYGYGSLLKQENIAAGAWGTWELVYHVGRLGVDDGGRVFLLFNAVADWSRFQFDDPGLPVMCRCVRTAMPGSPRTGIHGTQDPDPTGVELSSQCGKETSSGETRYSSHLAIAAVAVPAYARLQSSRTLPTSFDSWLTR